MTYFLDFDVCSQFADTRQTHMTQFIHRKYALATTNEIQFHPELQDNLLPHIAQTGQKIGHNKRLGYPASGACNLRLSDVTNYSHKTTATEVSPESVQITLEVKRLQSR